VSSSTIRKRRSQAQAPGVESSRGCERAKYNQFVKRKTSVDLEELCQKLLLFVLIGQNIKYLRPLLLAVSHI
jgi:hypothetical protein